MKIFKLPQLAELSENGEYCLGPEELNTSVYLLYGRLRPNEASRKIAAQAGSEEIICVVKGSIRVRCGKTSFSASSGEAFLLKDQTFYLDNLGDDEAIYIAAGGKAEARGYVKIPKEPLKETPAIKAAQTAEAPSEDDFEITQDDGEG